MTTTIETQPCALVVDDEGHVRAFLRDVLERAGHRVLEADTVAAGVETVGREEGLTLVVLDMRFPNGAGRSVLSRIVERRDDLPVIVVSSFPDDVEELAEIQPLVAVLEKPISVERFLEAVLRARRTKAAIDSMREDKDALTERRIVLTQSQIMRMKPKPKPETGGNAS